MIAHSDYTCVQNFLLSHSEVTYKIYTQEKPELKRGGNSRWSRALRQDRLMNYFNAVARLLRGVTAYKIRDVSNRRPVLTTLSYAHTLFSTRRSSVDVPDHSRSDVEFSLSCTFSRSVLDESLACNLQCNLVSRDFHASKDRCRTPSRRLRT